MKSIKYSLVSLFFLLSVNNIFACWHPWYSPAGYRLYRVVPTETSKDKSTTGGGDLLPTNSENCAEWQKLTSRSIPKKDIEHVVYKMTLQNFEEIYDNRNKKYKNKFAEWITKRDTTILEFLHLAKSNEYIREQMTSPWYYPTMTFNARMSIEEIADKAVAVKDMRLRNRYLLQAMRAYMSMEKYKECVEIWDNELSKLPKNDIIRRLSEQYHVGALFHVKHSEKAVEYFAQNGDIGSILYCTDQICKNVSPAEAISLICKYAPNSSKLPLMLHNFIRKIEPLGECNEIEPFKETEDTKLLYANCIEMGNNPKVKNQAMWYYTAAFLADLRNDLENAYKYISLAEKAKSSSLIDESIFVFRIYLDAKTSTYNSAYEQKLYEQLRWLDNKIVSNITPDVVSETTHGEKLICGYSYYWWNDVMRRILLAEVCPRMMKVGNTTRALQLANMASNRLLHIVNSVYIYGGGNSQPIKKYRYNDSVYNRYDYSNHFFEMIDSLGAENALKYVANTSNPASNFDRFLNNRGYTDSNYLYDIVGTQYLRNMQYAEAEKHLKKVDKTIDAHLNVDHDCNPFSIKKTHIKASKRFKYDFAKEMNKLTKTISSHKDPNTKAKAMFRFATGLYNSFNFCWELTQYYKGHGFWNRVCKKREWENDQYTKTATTEATRLFKLAIETATDIELKAQMEYKLCNFLTVAQKYPNTEKGKLVRGACDNLRDYHIEINNPINPFDVYKTRS